MVICTFVIYRIRNTLIIIVDTRVDFCLNFFSFIVNTVAVVDIAIIIEFEYLDQK